MKKTSSKSSKRKRKNVAVGATSAMAVEMFVRSTAQCVG